MNRLSRAVAALAAAGLAVPLWATPAFAETATETASSAAWFNRAGYAAPPELAAAPVPPPLVNEVDGVAEGNLGVAAQRGAEDKVAFLFFGLSELPFDATISKAVLKVPLVPSDNSNVRVGFDEPGVVSACKILGSGFSTEEGAALSLAPERDCPSFAAAATQEGESLVFDVTGLAATWSEVNDGLALTVPPGGDATFQVVLSKQATLDVEFTAPPADDTASGTDTGSVSVDSGLGTADFGGGFSGGTSDLGSGSASLGGGFGASALPALPADPNLPVPTPATAGDDPLVAAPVSAPGVFSDSSPTAGFFLAALLMAGVLALVSLVLGDNRTTPVSAAQPSRLAQALSARQRGAGLSALGPRAL